MVGARVDALAGHRLRRGQHDLPQGQLALDRQLEQERRALRVRVHEVAEVGHVILVGGQVKHVLDPVERARHRVPIGHIADHQVDFSGTYSGRPRGWTRSCSSSSTRTA